MSLSKGARDRALRGIVSGKLWLGLAWSVDDKAVREVNDPAYVRQPVAFGDPTHEDHRSTIAIAKSVDFPPFVFDAQYEIKNWFLIDSPTPGQGTVIATGSLDPQWMLDRAGTLYTLGEAALVAEKDNLKPVYPRPLAGAAAGMDAGDIWLYIEEGA